MSWGHLGHFSILDLDPSPIALVPIVSPSNLKHSQKKRYLRNKTYWLIVFVLVELTVDALCVRANKVEVLCLAEDPID